MLPDSGELNDPETHPPERGPPARQGPVAGRPDLMDFPRPSYMMQSVADDAVKRTPPHPINPWITNTRLADVYLEQLRQGRRGIAKLVGLILGCQIDCPVPRTLYIPHPSGIVIGSHVRLGESVTVMQQVTIGGKNPWCRMTDLTGEFPNILEGAYLGAGAKILGGITVGRWAIVGANAVITRDVPDNATVVGSNAIVKCAPPPSPVTAG